MIGLPKPPKQPSVRAPLGAWKTHLEQLKEWVHVFEQMENYKAHRFAVTKMDLKGADGTAPKFKRQPRKGKVFPKNKKQREYAKRLRGLGL